MNIKKKRTWLIFGIGVSIIGPLWGFLGTLVGIIRAFKTRTPEILAESIDFALWTSSVGEIIFWISLPILILCIVGLRRLNKSSLSSN